MIQAICFDLDGVLRLWDGRLVAQIEQESGLPRGTIHTIAFEPTLLEQAITGRISDDVWRDAIAERLYQQFPALTAAHAQTLIRRWSSSVGAVDEDVLAIVRECRRRVRVLLVTNATLRLSSDLACLGVDSEFDAIINSAELGWRKPQRELFHAVIDQAGVEASHILFVDDTPENVKAAEEAGLVGHLYRDALELHDIVQRYGVL